LLLLAQLTPNLWHKKNHRRPSLKQH